MDIQIKLEPRLLSLYFSSGPLQGRQEGHQEEGCRSLHPQGLVRREGPLHLQGSRGRKDLGQQDPGHQDRLRWTQGSRVRSFARRSPERDGKLGLN